MQEWHKVNPDLIITSSDGGFAPTALVAHGTWQDSGCWGKFIFAEKGNLPKDMVEEGLPPEKPLPLTYEFDLPEKGEATIQFFDDKNTIVRTLLASALTED